jgi:mannose-1-phosphate guanylyltransferase
MKVMVLAAGLGTRFQPHTDLIPKPAMPFLNAPLAAIALQSILPIEPKGLVVNTFHLPALIKNLFNVVLRPLGLPVEFSDETDFIRGSGGGLKFADTLFKEEAHFLLINSDEVFFPENSEFIQEAYAQHLSSGALSTLVTTTHPEVGSKFGGIWTDANHRVLGFGRNNTPEAAMDIILSEFKFYRPESFNTSQPIGNQTSFMMVSPRLSSLASAPTSFR